MLNRFRELLALPLRDRPRFFQRIAVIDVDDEKVRTEQANNQALPPWPAVSGYPTCFFFKRGKDGAWHPVFKPVTVQAQQPDGTVKEVPVKEKYTDKDGQEKERIKKNQ